MSLRLLCCSGSLEGGGSERQLAQLVSGIDRRRFAPEVYLLYRRGKYLAHLSDDVRVHHFWSDNGKASFTLPGQIHRRQVQHLQRVIEHQNIDVVYDRTFHMTLVTAAACRLTGTPRVSTIVSPPSKDFTNSSERFKWFKKRLLRRAYLESNGLTLAVSESVARDAEAFYDLPTDSVSVLPSPVDIASVRSQADEITAHAPCFDDDGASHWSVIGRMTKEKGHELALRAFAEFSGSVLPASRKLHLIGDGPERSALEHLASELGIAAKVEFHGFLENPYPAIRTSSAIIIPSLYEGLPNVALEAMVLRTPVIATDCSDSLTSLLADQGFGRVVTKRTPQALAEAMESLENQADEAEECIRRAEAYVEQNHSLERWLKDAEDEIESLMERLKSKAQHDAR